MLRRELEKAPPPTATREEKPRMTSWTIPIKIERDLVASAFLGTGGKNPNIL